ncbi:hypothetical protein JOC36_001539 [Weissella uvarum]|uniref:hypothetical protein n=1 Tax=Weissella uvarum TaxID=1479233 RepID=UPI00195F51F1|nr:hypothetical protein [Weissella uvarum]MBM7617945.1 hypothetical protein [Weissella uvarum]MCM0596164.1 hypothetical protein [Weissella uvarum]
MKKSFVSPQQYAMMIGDIAQLTEETGEKTSPFFEKLDEALKAEKLSDLDKAEFQDIAAAFEDAVDVYQDAAKKLHELKAPARILGMHKTLAQIYQDYADATKEMADSLDVDKQAVDLDAFRDSEEKQNDLITKFGAQIRRVMMSAM